MIASPANFARHIKNDASGKKIASDMIKLMPDAMIYTYTLDQPQTGRNPRVRDIGPRVSPTLGNRRQIASAPLIGPPSP